MAMSRVHSDDDYLFGGHYTRKHFVPNVKVQHRTGSAGQWQGVPGEHNQN